MPEARRVIEGTCWLLLENAAGSRRDECVRLSELLDANRARFTVYVLEDDIKQLWQYRAVHAMCWDALPVTGRRCPPTQATPTKKQLPFFAPSRKQRFIPRRTATTTMRTEASLRLPLCPPPLCEHFCIHEEKKQPPRNPERLFRW